MKHLDAIEKIIRDFNQAAMQRRLRRDELLDMFGVICQWINAKRLKDKRRKELLDRSRIFVNEFLDNAQKSARIHGERHARQYLEELENNLSEE